MFFVAVHTLLFIFILFEMHDKITVRAEIEYIGLKEGMSTSTYIVEREARQSHTKTFTINVILYNCNIRICNNNPRTHRTIQFQDQILLLIYIEK